MAIPLLYERHVPLLRIFLDAWPETSPISLPRLRQTLLPIYEDLGIPNPALQILRDARALCSRRILNSLVVETPDGLQEAYALAYMTYEEQLQRNREERERKRARRREKEKEKKPGGNPGGNPEGNPEPKPREST